MQGAEFHQARKRQQSASVTNGTLPKDSCHGSKPTPSKSCFRLYWTNSVSDFPAVAGWTHLLEPHLFMTLANANSPTPSVGDHVWLCRNIVLWSRLGKSTRPHRLSTPPCSTSYAWNCCFLHLTCWCQSYLPLLTCQYKWRIQLCQPAL